MFNRIRCSCKVLSNSYYSNVKLFLGVVKPYSTGTEVLPRINVSEKIIKVAIVGVPNAGKSTLINSLLDRKVCHVRYIYHDSHYWFLTSYFSLQICPTSNKVHTTLCKSSAVHTVDNTQIVFLDTPGLTSPNERKR